MKSLRCRFTDVASDAWYYDAVAYVYENGLMNGTSLTTFGPDVNITRGMIVTILYRLDGEPAASVSNFTDVPANAYYTDAVAWAAENGIVKGYDDGAFGPDDDVTMEQFAAILYRYAAYKGYDVSRLRKPEPVYRRGCGQRLCGRIDAVGRRDGPCEGYQRNHVGAGKSCVPRTNCNSSYAFL